MWTQSSSSPRNASSLFSFVTIQSSMLLSLGGAGHHGSHSQSRHKGTLYRGMQALEVTCLTELIITALQNSRGRRMPTRVLVVRCRKAQLVSVGVKNMEKALAPRSVGWSWGSHALLGE